MKDVPAEKSITSSRGASASRCGGRRSASAFRRPPASAARYATRRGAVLPLGVKLERHRVRAFRRPSINARTRRGARSQSCPLGRTAGAGSAATRCRADSHRGHRRAPRTARAGQVCRVALSAHHPRTASTAGLWRPKIRHGDRSGSNPSTERAWRPPSPGLEVGGVLDDELRMQAAVRGTTAWHHVRKEFTARENVGPERRVPGRHALAGTDADAAPSRQRWPRARVCGAGASPTSTTRGWHRAPVFVLRPATVARRVFLDEPSTRRRIARVRSRRRRRARRRPVGPPLRRREPAGRAPRRSGMAQRRGARRRREKPADLVTAAVARHARLRERKAATATVVRRLRDVRDRVSAPAIPRRRRRPSGRTATRGRALSLAARDPDAAAARAAAFSAASAVVYASPRGFARCECATISASKAHSRDEATRRRTPRRRRPFAPAAPLTGSTRRGTRRNRGAGLSRATRGSCAARARGPNFSRTKGCRGRRAESRRLQGFRPCPRRGRGAGLVPKRRRARARSTTDSRKLRITTDRLPHALAHVGAREGAARDPGRACEAGMSSTSFGRKSRRATPRPSRAKREDV